MGTLWQKFPQFKNPMDCIQVYPVAVTFTADLVAGKFTFPKVSKPAFTGNAGEIFVLDGVTMAANIDQLIFSNAIDVDYIGGFFELRMVRDGNKSPIGLAPFQFSAFNQGAEFSANWKPTATSNNEELFSFQLNGSLIQTPEIIALGKTEISLSITANIYRIKNNL